MRKRISYGRQHITAEDIVAVASTLTSDFITTGPKVLEFEVAFAEYVGSKYAVAVSNGTAALHLCAMALDVQPGTRVITTPITFAASANCVKYCGGELEFADIDPRTNLLDINKVREKLEAAPKGTYSGIIPVDFGGHPVDMEAFRALADEYGLWLIEDSCHSPGGSFYDSKNNLRKCGDGSLADLAIFSFHPVKHITCGEGGMVTTNDKNLYDKIMQLRTHGITADPEKLVNKDEGGWYYEMQMLGYNYRLTDFQAALGTSQLSRAIDNVKKRQEIAKKYDEVFADTFVETVIPLEGYHNAYHLYLIEVDNRREVFDHLRSHNIHVQIHYVPVHMHPYYQSLGHKKGDYPLAEAYYERCITLPIYPTLTDEEQDYVIETLLNFKKA